jgi:hypothetical protein
VGAPYEDPVGLGAAPDPVEVAARLDGTGPGAHERDVRPGGGRGRRRARRADGAAGVRDGGRSGRAGGARLVLVDRGLDPKAVSAPEVGHAELHHEYGEALRAYVGGGEDGVATWLVHCARAVALGAREGLAVCEAIKRGQA